MKTFRFNVFLGAAALLTLLGIITAQGAYAKDDPSAAEYHNAKKKLLQFEQSVEKRGMRENWINMIRLFDEILKKYPGGQYAAECRYNSARLYYELAKNSGAKKDAEKAREELLNFFDAYPEGKYSDDALYYAAEMAEKTQKKKEARLCLTKLVKRHKKGDFYAKAKKKLAALGGPLEDDDDLKKDAAKEETKIVQKQPLVEKEKDGADKKSGKPQDDKTPGAEKKKGGEEPPVDLAKKMIKIDEPSADKKAAENIDKAPVQLSILTGAAVEKKKTETVIKLTFKGSVSFTQGDAPATKDKPYRLFLDFSPAKTGAGIKAATEINSDFVIKMRIARYSETTLRVVLDLRKETLNAEIFQQTKNNETVIKITASDKPKTAAGGGAAEEKKDVKQAEKTEEKKEILAVKEEPPKDEAKETKKEEKKTEKVVTAEGKNEEKQLVKTENKSESKPDKKNKTAAEEKNDKPAQKSGMGEEKTADKKKDEIEAAPAGDALKNKLVEKPKDDKLDANAGGAKKDEPKEPKKIEENKEAVKDKDAAKEVKDIKEAKKEEAKETKKEEPPKQPPVSDKKDDIIKKIVEDANAAASKDGASKADEKKEPKKEEAKKSADEYELPKQLKVVAIDPGHGGKDWGAIGKRNTAEKDITLQISLKVKEKLEKKLPGVKVILTRSEDKSMKLKERTEIANNANADLFVSIHCNATLSRKMYGIETFFLNMASQKYAERLANRENAEIDSEEDELPYILADLITSANTDYSIKAATYVQSGMMSALKKKKYNQLEDRGVQPALLFVLLYAKMPSILVETSFISNLREEMRLNDAKYQDALAEGIVEGIYKYNIYLQDQAQ